MRPLQTCLFISFKNNFQLISFFHKWWHLLFLLESVIPTENVVAQILQPMRKCQIMMMNVPHVDVALNVALKFPAQANILSHCSPKLSYFGSSMNTLFNRCIFMGADISEIFHFPLKIFVSLKIFEEFAIFKDLRRIFELAKILRIHLRSIFRNRRIFLFVIGPFSIFVATLGPWATLVPFFLAPMLLYLLFLITTY